MLFQVLLAILYPAHRLLDRLIQPTNPLASHTPFPLRGEKPGQPIHIPLATRILKTVLFLKPHVDSPDLLRLLGSGIFQFPGCQLDALILTSASLNQAIEFLVNLFLPLLLSPDRRIQLVLDQIGIFSIQDRPIGRLTRPNGGTSLFEGPVPSLQQLLGSNDPLLQILTQQV